MTRPGPPPPRGRHAAPDDDARPDEGGPAGRHAAPDLPGRRHAAPDRDGYSDPPPRRRHAAPDEPPNGVPYHRPSLGTSIRYQRPDPYTSDLSSNGHPGPRANGVTYGPEPGVEPGPRQTGYPGRNGGRPAPTGQPGPDGYPGRNGVGPGPAGYAPGHPGRHRPEPAPNGIGARPDDDRYGDAEGRGYGRERSPNGYPPAAADPGRHRPVPERDGAGPGQAQWSPDEPAPGPIGYHLPNGGGHRRAEPEAGGPGANGVAYHRPEPGAHRYGGAGGAPHPWPETNGYHLDSPAPPAVNGYRLDEPVAPVTGFPYSAPPPAPAAYPVNGHGLDAAERDAASWPANRFHQIELDRAPDPRIAVVPLNDEPTEVLDRPSLTPATAGKPATASKPAKPAHPPRAVVRRRRARRKALEWPFLIVFAVVSAFLIRQYVVQTFYIPSASMHETLIEGDRVLVNKVGYHLHDIHRGDVVVFAKPANLNVSEDDLIKRVVALPGETVEGRGGKVYVNGAPLDEPYVEPLCHGTGDFAKVTVPAGRLWVMGDNRCNSSDSRVFGPIDERLVVGRAFVIAWPFDRLSWL
jgi:signal peptidase I